MPHLSSVDWNDLLYRAVQDGRPFRVARALAHGADPNVFGARGQVPLVVLHNRRGTLATVLRQLRDAGADLNARCADGNPVLFRLITLDAPSEVLHAVLDAGADPTLTGRFRSHDETFITHPLEHAVLAESFGALNALLDRVGRTVGGIDPNQANATHGWTALHWACAHERPGHCAAIRRLIAVGADPDAINHVEETPRQMVFGSAAAALREALLDREQALLRATIATVEGTTGATPGRTGRRL